MRLTKTPPRPLFAMIRHRRFWCLVLCLVTWRGPLPVLHCHDDDRSRLPLAVHVNEVHEGHVESDWHLHFLPLRDLARHCPVDDESLPDESPIRVEVGSHIVPVIVHDVVLVAMRACDDPLVRRWMGHSVNRGARERCFANSRLAERSCQSLLGIARC